MQSHPVKKLTPMEAFALTLQEVEIALGSDLVEKIEIKISETETSALSILAYNMRNPNLLATCFVRHNKTAHIVCYPGADKDNTIKADVPLKLIAKAVDKELLAPGYQDLKIRKHFIASVYSKNPIGEGHFVAIAEVDKKLSVINPKGSIVSTFSNPDMDYLQTFMQVSAEPLAADVQGPLDRASCGYIVAAIHAKMTAELISDFSSLMQTINTENAVGAYTSIMITQDGLNDEIEKTRASISKHIKKLEKNIDSVFIMQDRIYMWTQKKNYLNDALDCLAGKKSVWILNRELHEGKTQKLVEYVKRLIYKQKLYQFNFHEKLRSSLKIHDSPHDYGFTHRTFALNADAATAFSLTCKNHFLFFRKNARLLAYKLLQCIEKGDYEKASKIITDHPYIMFEHVNYMHHDGKSELTSPLKFALKSLYAKDWEKIFYEAIKNKSAYFDQYQKQARENAELTQTVTNGNIF